MSVLRPLHLGESEAEYRHAVDAGKILNLICTYFSTHSFGVTPVAFLKARLKVALLLKPQS